MKSGKYQLIIFDWDGTIIDSQAHIINSMQKAMADENLPMPRDDEVRHVIGLSLDSVILSLLPELNDTTVNRISDNYRRHFFANINQSRLFDGVAETIQDLHASGYFLAVATGKGRRGLDLALKNTGLEPFFHITRCADETRSKPDPLMLDEILTDLDLAVENAIMVGDTSYDMDMAGNIKMDCVAVTYGMHNAEHLKTSNPTYLIDSIDQLSQYV